MSFVLWNIFFRRKFEVMILTKSCQYRSTYYLADDSFIYLVYTSMSNWQIYFSNRFNTCSSNMFINKPAHVLTAWHKGKMNNVQNKNNIAHRYISTTDEIQHNNVEEHPGKRESTTHKYYVNFVDKCLTLSKTREQYINMTCCP